MRKVLSRGGTAGLRHVDDCRSSSFVAFVFPSAFPLSCLCLPFCISCLSSLLWFLVSVLLWSLCLVFIFPFAFPGCLPFCVSLCLSFCVPFVLSMSSLLRFLLVLLFCASLCRSFCVPCVLSLSSVLGSRFQSQESALAGSSHWQESVFFKE